MTMLIRINVAPQINWPAMIINMTEIIFLFKSKTISCASFRCLLNAKEKSIVELLSMQMKSFLWQTFVRVFWTAFSLLFL